MKPQMLIELSEIMATKLGSIDPSKFPDELFDLYSIPAFDQGESAVIPGNQIGSAKQIVQTDDVMLSKIVPHIRRAWIVCRSKGYRIIASGEWIVFRSKKFDNGYLRQVLVSDPFNKEFMGTVAGVGGSLLRARPAHVAKIKIPLPPLPEQRRIAAILDKAESLRAKRRAALAKLDQLAQSIFLEMFGDGISRKSRVKIVTLDEILLFVTSGGRGWAQYYSNEGDRFIRSLDVRMNSIGSADIAYIVAPKNAESKRTQIRCSDVLLTITGSLIGRVSAVPNDLAGAYISQHVAILRPDPNLIDSIFLSYYLSFDFGGQKQISKSQYGQTKPGLNFDQIRSFTIPLPPLPLQQVFAKRIEAIESLKTAHRASLAKLDDLFASLQHRAFRGEL